jgi:hypothetical protein
MIALVFTSCVLLSGCSRTITTSLFEIDEEYVSDELSQEILVTLENGLSDFDIQCELSDESTNSYSCRLGNQKQTYLRFGKLAAEPMHVIYVETSMSPLFPASEVSLRSGKFSSKIHKELEILIPTLFPKDFFVKAERRYLTQIKPDPIPLLKE